MNIKYIVVSCCEREIELEGVFDSYLSAKQKMKECFIEHHRNHNFFEDDLADLINVIETGTGDGYSDFNFAEDYAWTNLTDDYLYDIRIFSIPVSEVQ